MGEKFVLEFSRGSVKAYDLKEEEELQKETGAAAPPSIPW